MSPRVVDRDQKRGQILEAAARTFSSKGYANTKVEDVAREAGVAKGTVYLYFASREEILLAAFRAFEEELFARVGAALETGEPALVRLRSVIRAVLHRVEAEPELSRVVLDFLAAGTFGGGADRGIDFGRVYAEYRGIVGGLLEEARREGTVRRDLPKGAPAVVVGAIEGVVLQWIVDPRAASPREMVSPVLDMLVEGLRDKEAR